jgi:hypothetical protein
MIDDYGIALSISLFIEFWRTDIASQRASIGQEQDVPLEVDYIHLDRICKGRVDGL